MDKLATAIIELIDRAFDSKYDWLVLVSDLLEVIEEYSEPIVVKYWCKQGHILDGFAAESRLVHSRFSGIPPKCSICRNRMYRVGVDMREAIVTKKKKKKA